VTPETAATIVAIGQAAGLIRRHNLRRAADELYGAPPGPDRDRLRRVLQAAERFDMEMHCCGLRP